MHRSRCVAHVRGGLRHQLFDRPGRRIKNFGGNIDPFGDGCLLLFGEALSRLGRRLLCLSPQSGRQSLRIVYKTSKSCTLLRCTIRLNGIRHGQTSRENPAERTQLSC